MANSNENNNNNKKFQPEPHLERRDGQNYLPLKWRLTWLRSEQPQAQVWTRLVSHDNGLAVFRAKIKVPDGGVATGWGARSRGSDGGDNHSGEIDLSYIAEAENQALERALTVLGYGTEYASDFDAPIENEGIALNVVTLPTLAPEVPTAAPIPIPTPPVARPNFGLPENRTAYEADEDPSDPPDRTEPAEPDESDLDENEEPTPQPTNIRSVSRTPLTPTPARPPSNVTAMPTNPAANRGGLSSTPRPLTRPAPVAPVTPTNLPAPTIGSPAVNERLQGIEDSGLRMAIKQIYYQARILYNLDEDKVDQRSIRTYNLPANELNLEQAEEFLERIKNGPRKGQ